MMDIWFWWLRCRASQDQFRYYWDAGSKNQKLGWLPHQTSPRHVPWNPQNHSCGHLRTGWHLL
jgi:hypothetical protein